MKPRGTGITAGSQYDTVNAGEWQTPRHGGYLMACCDCGLVHRLEFRVRRGAVQFRAWRDNRRTGQLRRQDTRRKRLAKHGA